MEHFLLCFPIPSHAKRKPTWQLRVWWLAKFAWYDPVYLSCPTGSEFQGELTCCHKLNFMMPYHVSKMHASGFFCTGTHVFKLNEHMRILNMSNKNYTVTSHPLSKRDKVYWFEGFIVSAKCHKCKKKKGKKTQQQQPDALQYCLRRVQTCPFAQHFHFYCITHADGTLLIELFLFYFDRLSNIKLV